MRTTVTVGAISLCALFLSAGAMAGGAAPTAVDGGVMFSFEAPGATSVHLAGEFNFDSRLMTTTVASTRSCR